MIHCTNFESRNLEQLPSRERELPVEKALACLVADELGFGGMVVGISPTKVTVEHELVDVKNTAIFEGSQKEMGFLVNVAAHHAVLMNDKMTKNLIVNQAMDFLMTVPDKEIGDTSRYVAMMSSVLMGRTSASIALLFAAGIKDLETMKVAATVSLEDLALSVELHRKTGASLAEIIKEIVLHP